MRIYKTLGTAADEIKRDIYKSATMRVSRVQQRDGLDLDARETFGYSYSILPGGIPTTPDDLVDLGFQQGFKSFVGYPVEMKHWLIRERDMRLDPTNFKRYSGETERLHPALKSVFEGFHPSYTYRERLVGMLDTMEETLRRNKDTRRAYWPIYQPVDAHRSMAPTRIPCSIGYQFMIRTMPDGQEVILMIYDQRSSDFDTFWLSDVWLAHQMQIDLVNRFDGQYHVGPFIHFIHSFHSFTVGEQEIY